MILLLKNIYVKTVYINEDGDRRGKAARLAGER